MKLNKTDFQCSALNGNVIFLIIGKFKFFPAVFPEVLHIPEHTAFDMFL